MPRALVTGILSVLFVAPLIVKAEFYTFEENRVQNISEWQDPAQMIEKAAKMTTDLLRWLVHNQGRPIASEKYNRLEHFGAWIDDGRTPECYDTRALVLIRDSETQVKMSPNNPCKVYSGTWQDPYSGRTLKTAKEIEVDHVVALKNAYDSGAYAWDFKHRCLYANFMGYDHHLLSVSMEENRAKSDRGPEKWMPSNPQYACEHLQSWLLVKYIWQLNMSEDEATAIENLVNENNCNLKMFLASSSAINKIRKYAQNNLSLCEN